MEQSVFMAVTLFIEARTFDDKERTFCIDTCSDGDGP